MPPHARAAACCREDRISRLVPSPAFPFAAAPKAVRKQDGRVCTSAVLPHLYGHFLHLATRRATLVGEHCPQCEKTREKGVPPPRFRAFGVRYSFGYNGRGTSEARLRLQRRAAQGAIDSKDRWPPVFFYLPRSSNLCLCSLHRSPSSRSRDQMPAMLARAPRISRNVFIGIAPLTRSAARTRTSLAHSIIAT